MNVKGEGSFKVNKDGSVTHRKSVGYKPNGNRKVLTVTASSKAACIKAMKKKEAEWNEFKERMSIEVGDTVTDLCKAHLEYQIQHGELKPKSVDRRELTIKHIDQYFVGRMQMQAVNISDVEEMITEILNDRKLSASSIEKIVDVLNAAYKWGINRGQLFQNPVEPIKKTLDKRVSKLRSKSAEDPDVLVLTSDEQERFVYEAMRFNIAKDQFVYPAGPYGVFLLYSGLRIGECLALRWRDVDFQNRILTVNKSRSMAVNRDEQASERKQVMIEGTTKNEKARQIRLSDDAINVLRLIYEKHEKPKADDYVCITSTGRANTASNVEHGCATIFRRIGMSELKGGLHIFRRTFATNAYRQGKHVKDIAAYIGDLESTTLKYYIAARQKMEVNGTTHQIVSLEGSD